MLKKMTVILIFLINIANPQVLTSQWAKFANNNDATSVASNDSSIVWMGTKAGLVRWDIDKDTYKIFDKSNGLPSVIIHDIKFDKLGNLWITTDNGIVKYNGITFELFNYQNSPLPNTQYTGLTIDSEGNIYAIMNWFTINNTIHNGGIVKYKSGQWEIFDGNAYGFTSPPSCVIAYKDTVYLNAQTSNFGWSMFYLANDKISLDKNWNYNVYIWNFTIDYQDSLWATCGLRLFKRRNNSWDQIIGEDAHVGSVWYYGWSNGFDGLWLGGSGPYLYYLNISNSLIGIKYDSNLPPGLKLISNNYLNVDSNGIFTNQIALTPDKQLFVSRNGLFLYNRDGIFQKCFQIPKTIDGNYIYSLGVSPKNEILVSGNYIAQKYDGQTWSSIISFENGGGWTNDFCYTPDEKMHTSNSFGYAHGADVDLYGNLWTAYGDLNEYIWPYLTKKEYTLRDLGIITPPNQWTPQLMDITVDKYNRIWADGWHDAAVMYDSASWHLYHSTDVGLQYGWDADYIFTDSKGRVWFTDNQRTPNEGIVLNYGGKWSIIRFTGLYWASYVYQIAEDNFGNLWFATAAGLLEFDNSNWYLLNSSNSQLDVSDIRAVTADQRGNIWIGTTAGLYVYNPQGLDLSSDITSSPADILSLDNYENGTKVKFKIKIPTTSVYKYELQRGRLPFKFWTVSAIKPTSLDADTLQIVDSSVVNGDYYYRIKEIDLNGKALYSQSAKFTGNGQSVIITNFKGVYLGDKMGFNWQTTNEHFISYFEVTQYDSTTNLDSTLLIVKAKNNGAGNNYEAVAGDLGTESKPKEYRLIAVFVDSTSQILKTTVFSPTIPTQFEVSQNYPNPFNGQTTINFNLPVKEFVTLRIYDILGKLIKVPVRKDFDKGYYTIDVNLLELASGVYIYEFTAGGFHDVKKMILLK
ncbi:MAG: T9SS type A sorting domain-containing protein [Ignavibacteriaceae bacterium]